MSYLSIALISGDRPNSNSNDPEERRLGKALINYTHRGSNTYNPVFDRDIRGLRPDWFESTSIKKKEKLLELAKSGAKRPNRNDNSFGVVLGHYTRKGGSCYDPVFDEKIRELRPDWFIRRVDNNKEELFALARSGAKRPKRSSGGAEGKLDGSLRNYTHKNSECYDPVFDKKIRELRPDWFIRRVDKNKEELFALARSGAKRPKHKAKDHNGRDLGCILSSYTSKHCSIYDPDFDEEIRELRPDWFNRRRRKI